MSNYRLPIRQADRAVFNDVVAGRKTVETRAATPRYRQVKIGDTLTFACGPDEVAKTVVSVSQFASLEDLYHQVEIKHVLPAAKNFDDAKRIHYSFTGYEQKLREHGILAFGLS